MQKAEDNSSQNLEVGASSSVEPTRTSASEQKLLVVPKGAPKALKFPNSILFEEDKPWLPHLTTRCIYQWQVPTDGWGK